MPAQNSTIMPQCDVSPYLHVGGGLLDGAVGDGHSLEAGGLGCLGDSHGAHGNSHGGSNDASHFARRCGPGTTRAK